MNKAKHLIELRLLNLLPDWQNHRLIANPNNPDYAVVTSHHATTKNLQPSILHTTAFLVLLFF